MEKIKWTLLLIKAERNNKVFYLTWGKVRLKRVFIIERQNQCGLEK